MKDLKKHITWIIKAHQQFPRKPSNAIRYWDNKTPYSIHPIWCAMTIMSETTLPKRMRAQGALALLYHDILEDTTKKLPTYLGKSVKNLVTDMTFYEGLEEEKKKVWSKGNEVILLKLYDKVSTLLDAAWMKPQDLRDFQEYTLLLRKNVLGIYGELNITIIAKNLIRTHE